MYASRLYFKHKLHRVDSLVNVGTLEGGKKILMRQFNKTGVYKMQLHLKTPRYPLVMKKIQVLKC